MNFQIRLSNLVSAGEIAVAVLPVALVLMVLRCEVHAVEYHVKVDGSDRASGLNRESAFATLQRAASAVKPGDTVIVGPGVYFEQVKLTTSGTNTAPITFKADAVARGRVIITGALRAVREGKVIWGAEPTVGPGVWSIPLGHLPVRVLAGDVDLYRYASLAELRQSRVKNVAVSGKPGPGPMQGWAWQDGRLYVRIHPSGRFGSVDPNAQVMKIGPVAAHGSRGDRVEKGSDYNFAALTRDPAGLILDGFTFETPGLCGVYAPRGGVTVRNCWFIGCRAGVAGSAATAQMPTCADVVVERCEHTEQGVMHDVREVVDIFATFPGPVRAAQAPIYWWHRKGGATTYEFGVVAAAGDRWKIRNNYVHDVFDGLSYVSTSYSRDMEVTGNVFANLVDNAIELEEGSEGLRATGNYIRDVWEPFSFQPIRKQPPFPSRAEIAWNVVEMRPLAAEFWLNPAIRHTGGCFKLFSPEGVPVSVAPPGIRFHHNTIWHRAGSAFNFGNQGSSMRGFSFSDNILCARSLDVRVTPPKIPFFTLNNNVAVPSFEGSKGPGSVFAGRDGRLESHGSNAGLVDPNNGDFSLSPGSWAETAGNKRGPVGALKPGEKWKPPVVGPELTPLRAYAATGRPPVAVADRATVAAGKAIRIYVRANDSDPDRNELTIVAVTAPTGGTVETEGGALVYQNRSAKPEMQRIFGPFLFS